MHDLDGAEFLAGMPGTVGGALAMNAGCYGGETWDIVEHVVDRSTARARCTERASADFDIGYRHCALEAAARGMVRRRVVRARARRRRSVARAHQGAARASASPRSRCTLPNAGSVFRNPPGDHAARLIESCGLKGFARGGARVSEKHANFIVNPDGAASAADIEWLIQHVQRTVCQMHGRGAACPKCASSGEARHERFGKVAVLHGRHVAPSARSRS